MVVAPPCNQLIALSSYLEEGYTSAAPRVGLRSLVRLLQVFGTAPRRAPASGYPSERRDPAIIQRIGQSAERTTASTRCAGASGQNTGIQSGVPRKEWEDT
jgi:hypothetical protein